MAPDGSGQRAVTGGERRYEWPSAADDGTIVAADETGRLHRLTLDGAALGAPIPTAATAATEDAPAETPTHVRISPDGARIAYDAGDRRRPDDAVDARGRHRARRSPARRSGRQGLVAPSWIGNGALLLSRDVTADEPGATSFSLYAVGGGDDSAEPWFSDDGATWATGFDAAASRSGTRIAVLEDDAADNDGTPRARRAAAVRRRRAGRAAGVPLRDRRWRPRTPTARPARRSRPTAPGSPGPRATASTSPRSARSTTAARSASRSSRSPAPGSPTGRPATHRRAAGAARGRAAAHARGQHPRAPAPARRCASAACAPGSRSARPRPSASRCGSRARSASRASRRARSRTRARRRSASGCAGDR